jgi:hypothetical protein
VLGAVWLAGCGGGSAAADPPAEQYPALRDFQLEKDRPAAMTIRVERHELKLIVQLANRRDGRANRSLQFTLERLGALDATAVEASPIALGVWLRPRSEYTLYVGRTTANLEPGWYRLTLEGVGRLLSVNVAQD